MLMTNQSFSPRRPHTSRLPYGKAQELIMRRALQAARSWAVRYTKEIDTIYKLDAVVIDRERPLLPAVGLQFTTMHSPDKMQSTIDMIRRTGIVERLLYLEAECRIDEAAFVLIQTLVHYTAETKPAQGIVTAILGKDEQGRFCLRDLRCYSIEADRPAIAA